MDKTSTKQTLVQAREDTACINMSPTVLSMKSCHIYLEGMSNVSRPASFVITLTDKIFRANENGSMLAKVALEKKLLRTELVRRIMKGQFFYNPQGSYKPVGH